METAIAYIRVSDPKQVAEGNSLVTQERLVREYSRSQGYNLLRVFIERGQSAKTDNRTVLQEMLEFAKANFGKIHVLIFPKIDRFARQLPDYLNLKARLNRLNIRIDSVGEHIEDTPVGRLTEHLLASIAQFDNEIRAERSRGGSLQAAREGRWVASPPFGLRRTKVDGKVTVEPHPEVAPIWIDVMLRIGEGQTPNFVLQHLRSKGIRMARSYFYRLIRNKAYIGLIERYGEVNVGKPPFVPLISQHLFDAVQRSLRPRVGPKTYVYDNPDFPLRGTLKCQCGTWLVGAWAKGRISRYPYYRCMNCRNVNHGRLVVHEAFSGALKQSTLGPDCFEVLRLMLDEGAGAARAEFRARHERLTRRAQTLKQVRRELARKTLSEVIPEELAKEQFEETGAELVSIEKALAIAGKPDDDLPALLQFAEEFLTTIDDRWSKAGVTNQKKLQRFVFPEGLTIWRDGRLRTAKRELAPGLRRLATANLSSVAAHRDKHTNQSIRPRKPKSKSPSRGLDSIIQFLKELVAEFGSDSK